MWSQLSVKYNVRADLRIVFIRVCNTYIYIYVEYSTFIRKCAERIYFYCYISCIMAGEQRNGGWSKERKNEWKERQRENEKTQGNNNRKTWDWKGDMR